MAKNGVTITVNKAGEVLAGIAKLAELRVMVGIPEEKAGRREGDISNAALARIHEHGAPEVNIPARPFLVPGALAVRAEAASRLKQASAAALAGKPKQVESIFMAIGLLGQNAVRRAITLGNFVPLKASTLAARRRRGRTGTKPLIDTGQLRAAITYVIRRGK